ncbi:MAG: hypothetical protein K5798_03835 [Nitrosopumilus sp.]|uniref:hypothetical protein n=1 Tax=Nitrosopumilus sp. TaxID=2024843 RepID=UPI00242C4FC4|nr:hypothetical protein [Nitrosopumilus sp.]MCV0366383.1 hypothetical protein [Nitrosopumilus sp.]
MSDPELNFKLLLGFMLIGIIFTSIGESYGETISHKYALDVSTDNTGILYNLYPPTQDYDSEFKPINVPASFNTAYDSTLVILPDSIFISQDGNNISGSNVLF